MKLLRKHGKKWHFAEPEHCEWAATYTDRQAFDEHIDVPSLEAVNGDAVCGLCRRRRDH